MKKSFIEFTAQCECGWSYGPALQTDALQQAKWHKQGAGCALVREKFPSFIYTADVQGPQGGPVDPHLRGGEGDQTLPFKSREGSAHRRVS